MERAAEHGVAEQLFGASPERRLLLLRAAWPRAVGPELARRTEVIAIEGNALRIRVPDAGWRKGLLRMRHEILGRLRGIAGGLAPRALGFVEARPAPIPMPAEPSAPALPEPPPLLALVPEQLGDGEPPDRLFQGLCPRPNHSRERGRHFRSQGDAPVTLVREFVELADDFLSALRRVQLQRLERRSIVLLEAIATRDLAPGREDVVAEGEFFGVKVAKSR